MGGYVYALESADAVKIGYAKDPVRRSHNLRIGNSQNLSLRGYVIATRTQEAELHSLLAPYRIRGEWFRKAGPVVFFLGCLGQQPRFMARKSKGDFGLQQAIARAGSAQILAGLVGVTPQAICLWKKVPVNRVVDVERVTGIPRHLLRPDFWQHPAIASAKPSEAA